MYKLAIACLAVMAPLFAAAAGPVPLVDFARHAKFSNVKISPDGTYLAATVPQEDRTSLAVIRLADQKITGVMNVGTREHIHEFWWKGTNRVLADLATRDSSLEQPQLTGELIAMDADGRNSKYLYGYRGQDQGGGRVSGDTRHYGHLQMIDPMMDDPRYALVATYDWHNGQNMIALVHRINVNNGALTRIAVAPLPGPVEFLADQQGNLRYAVGTEVAGLKVKTFHRNAGNDNWMPEENEASGASEIIPLTFSADGKSVYLKYYSGAAPACLVEEVVETGARHALACDPAGDLTGPLMALDGSKPIGAMFEAGQPTATFFDESNPDSALLKGVNAAFPGQSVTVVSATRDGAKAVVLVHSDRNPGDFYLLDHATRKVVYLMSRRDWIDPDQMSEVRPVVIKARDGAEVYGYLTLPRGIDPKKLPLIVHPHGGPFGVRDYWHWEDDPQMLASRGYAVLQVNFRGSGGYGLKFHDEAKRSWGGIMIDDIIDATRWAVSAGYADPARMCIYGGSYGGYASLMSAVREPDLFRCVVAYAGVYDLNLWKRQSDVGKSRIGESYIEEFVGRDKKELAEQSPLTFIDKLKAPVLIVHGEEDQRVPYDQAKALMSALDERKVHYETLFRPAEGHGFYKETNRQELYEKLLAFFQKNIGTAPATTADAK